MPVFGGLPCRLQAAGRRLPADLILTLFIPFALALCLTFCPCLFHSEVELCLYPGVPTSVRLGRALPLTSIAMHACTTPLCTSTYLGHISQQRDGIASWIWGKAGQHPWWESLRRGRTWERG